MTAVLISAGAVPGMLEWMPSSSGAACVPIDCTTAAPQSPPCATNRVYPSRFISTTQARATRTVCRGVGQRADDLQLLDDGSRPTVRHDQRQGVLVRGANVQEVDVEPVDL